MASKGKALTIQHDRKEDPIPDTAEKLPQPEDLVVPAALLLCADAASEHKDERRPYLQTVYLHAKDGLGRCVGTDGSRMFVASFPIEGKEPTWLADGLLLSNDGLKPRIGMTGKGEGAVVRITYQSGMARATLSDFTHSMAFQIDRVDGIFPDYEKVIPTNAFQKMDDEGNLTGNEWEPVGINSVYLKHVGEVAKMLDASLPKAVTKRELEARKKGMIVRAFNSGGKSDRPIPLVFDFSTYPGAILVIMPAKLSSTAISSQTAALLAPAVRGTIRALQAHVTRNVEWAKASEDEAEKASFTAKAEGFEKRIAEILKRAPGVDAPALGGPEPEAETVMEDPSSEEPEEEEPEEQQPQLGDDEQAAA